MSFPAFDQYWLDTASFVQTNFKEGDKIVAPLDFTEKLKVIYPYSTQYRAHTANFQWIILHKGMLLDFNKYFLTYVADTLIPVFANEVFVVFSQHRDLTPVMADAPHLQALWVAMRHESGFWPRLRRVLKQWKLAMQPSGLSEPQPQASASGEQHLSDLVPDYAALSVSEIRELMNQRYEANAAYDVQLYGTA